MPLQILTIVTPRVAICVRPVSHCRFYTKNGLKPCYAAMSDSKTESIGEVVTHSLLNKPWVRPVGVIGTLWLASNYIPLPSTYQYLMHFFSYSGWFGSTIWVLLLSPKLVLQTVSRTTFGKIQAKLFPQYFGFSAAMLSVMMWTNPLPSMPYTVPGAFALNAVNWLFLEPKITALMLRRHGLEDAENKNEEEISALKKASGKLHGGSSILALIGFVCAVAHGVTIASLIKI